MTLVDDCGESFELRPDVLAVFFGYGTGLAPQVMQGLQFLEGLYHIGFLGKEFGLLYEVALYFQVFLEIKVAKLFVHLQTVENLLYHQLVVLPAFVDSAGGDVGD